MPELEAMREQAIEINTLVGVGSRFEGKLKLNGSLRIDGEFSGQITSGDTIVVSPGAHVEGELKVESVLVEGTVEGTIHATRSVEIYTPGQVKGDIVTPSLFIDKGVVFEGSCQMCDPPAGNGPTGGDPQGSDPTAG